MDNQVMLSIVIANYNYGSFLDTAIKSVVTQEGFSQCELIVIDGQSTDNSVEVIQKYANNISWWVSEKDKGQADAINKGFAKARGRYLTWLNADDAMLEGAIKCVLNFIKTHPNVEWFSGETIYVDNEFRVITTGVRMCGAIGRFFNVPAWARITAPSTFFTKKLLEKVGGIDKELHYVMDTDLWIKFHKSGCRLLYMERYIWAFRLHEQSKTSASVVTGKRNERFIEERTIIRGRQGITPLLDWFAVFGKKVCCMLSFGYLRRTLFLIRYKGYFIGDKL